MNARLSRDPLFVGAASVAVVGALVLALSGASPKRVAKKPAPDPKPIASSAPAPAPAVTAAAAKRVPRNRATWIVDPQGGPDVDAKSLAEINTEVQNGDIVLLRPGKHVLALDLDRDVVLRGTAPGVFVKPVQKLRVRNGNVRLEKLAIINESAGLGIDVDRGSLSLYGVTLQLAFPDRICLRDGARFDVNESLIGVNADVDAEDATLLVSDSGVDGAKLSLGGRTQATLRDVALTNAKSIAVHGDAQLEMMRVQVRELASEMLVSDRAVARLRQVVFKDSQAKPALFVSDRATLRLDESKFDGTLPYWLRGFDHARIEVDGEELADPKVMRLAANAAPKLASAQAVDRRPATEEKPEHLKKDDGRKAPIPDNPSPADPDAPAPSAFASQIDFSPKTPRESDSAMNVY